MQPLSDSQDEWLDRDKIRQARLWANFEVQLSRASNGHAVTPGGFQTFSIGSNEESWLDSLPVELKIVILCLLDEVSLSALMRAFPAYNDVFVSYCSEIHTAVTINTLRIRDIDLQLRKPTYWLEVSSTIPKPHYPRIWVGFAIAVGEYQRQCFTKQTIRMSSDDCMILCSIQDAIAWYLDNDDYLACFGRPSGSPNRLPIHTYTLVCMDESATKTWFWELLVPRLREADPWFTSDQFYHKFGSDSEWWIRREREEPMDRLTFGPARTLTTMDWLDEEGMADTWEWLFK